MGVADFLITVLAGIVGTIGMSIVMYIYSKVAGTDTRVIHMFGTMLTSVADHTQRDGKTLTTGIIAHFGVGVLFAIAYYLLWNWGFFSTEFIDSVILGALSGVAAIIAWNTYFFLHHDPPKISRTHYSIALFIAHVVFGIVTVYVFTIMSPDPRFWYQLN